MFTMAANLKIYLGYTVDRQESASIVLVLCESATNQ